MIGHGPLSFRYVTLASALRCRASGREKLRHLRANALRDMGQYADELRLRKRWCPRNIDGSQGTMSKFRHLLGAYHLHGCPENRVALYRRLRQSRAYRTGDANERMVIEVENLRFSVTEKLEWKFDLWMDMSEAKWRSHVRKCIVRAQDACEAVRDPRVRALFDRTVATFEGRSPEESLQTYRETDSILGMVNAKRDLVEFMLRSGDRTCAAEVLRQSLIVSDVIGDQPGRCKAATHLAFISDNKSERKKCLQAARTALDRVQWTEHAKRRFYRAWSV
jgi:hypothetical protein